jgi:hypothetical protein
MKVLCISFGRLVRSSHVAWEIVFLVPQGQDIVILRVEFGI